MARGNTGRVRFLTGKLTQSVGNVTAAALLGSVTALIAAGVVRLIASQLTASYLTLLAIGLLLLLVAAAASYDALRAQLMSRKGFYGFNTIVMVLLFLAIASIIIFVGAKNNQRFDTTSAREFSLAKQTKQILQDLNNDIEAIAFFTPTDPLQAQMRGPALDLLEEYAQVTGRFDYRVVDPDIEPEEARRFGINPDTEPGTIVFNSENNLQPVNTVVFSSRGGQYVPNQNLERDYSQAILAVTRKQQKTVYFVERHGERDSNNASEGNGYGLAKLGLEGDNYLVRVLDLAGTQKVPEDAAVLVIAGPERDLLEEEHAPLRDYLRKGGKALVLLDPDPPESFRAILREWGVTVTPGTVVDAANSIAENTRAPLIRRARYNDPLGIGLTSPITRVLTDSTFFERSAAIEPIENQGKDAQPPQPNVFYASPSLVVTPLVITTDFFSWRTLDRESTSFKQGDVRGPLALGVSIEAAAPFGEAAPRTGNENPPQTQIVVIGDSDFASNRFYTSFANGDLFVNSVNWLAGDVELISVRPKIRQPRLLVVTGGTFDFIRWSSWVFLPVAAAGVGVFVWWRRR